MKLSIYEMPLDYGASRHGSDMGPSAIRLAGLKQHLEENGHTIATYKNLLEEIEITPPETQESGNIKAKYLEPIKKACCHLASNVYSALIAKTFPLVLGGDHSIALGSIAGVAKFAKESKKTLGILYIDAHGDFNTTETTPTGNIHGECLAASCGYGIPDLTNLYFNGRKVEPGNVCYVGVRDLDKGEALLMKEAGVTVFTMSDIDKLGFFTVIKRVLLFFRTHCDLIHVSFDMDVLDPMFAPGTGIPLPAGLTNREALLLMEEIAATNMVISAEVVEVNPILDVRNQTALLATSLIARLLGEKIY